MVLACRKKPPSMLWWTMPPKRRPSLSKGVLAIDDWNATLDFGSTQEWKDRAYVDAGKVTLGPGRHELTITPLEMPNGDMAGVRRVLLKPVKAE